MLNTCSQLRVCDKTKRLMRMRMRMLQEGISIYSFQNPDNQILMHSHIWVFLRTTSQGKDVKPAVNCGCLSEKLGWIRLVFMDFFIDVFCVSSFYWPRLINKNCSKDDKKLTTRI